MKNFEYRDIENLRVYTRLCDLHIQICELCNGWPRAERFELTSQVLRSSNSSPAQLAEKNEDRHLKNRIEGVNRARGEAGETIHHLRIATRKGYLNEADFKHLKEDYRESILILNAIEKNLETKLPSNDQKWLHEPEPTYHVSMPAGYPEPL
ncbi:MAG: four helix bundle protein [Verrucomicrobia bacterium]|nr:four helix bundle protein [Verrucomicrobiota bacterium]MCH8510145.1 four helix bundle protein [Kiritimatiellia bacterium]